MAEQEAKPARALKARVKVIVEEVQTQGEKETVMEPTVYEQTLPADKLDLQSIIEAVNKNLHEPTTKSNPPGAA